MKYNPITSISESRAAMALLSCDRTRIARAMLDCNRVDRLELARRLHWIGYPVKRVRRGLFVC